MFIVGVATLLMTAVALITLVWVPRPVGASSRHVARAFMVALLAATAMLLSSSGTRAAIVPTVGLATAANYSVLAGSTVTNTGDSVLAERVGLAPGTAVVGFPPGSAVGIDADNAVASQAQADLTVGYVDAAGRSINATTTSELAGLTLVGGVYAGPSSSALTLNGTLTLDGENDPDSVFIFQTDSTLISGSGSTVSLINGAQECNVFWQVGSSATLGSGSTFRGNILALTSITVNTDVTVHGRALARNAAVTLDDDDFIIPTCDLTTTTTTDPDTSTTDPTTTTTDPDTSTTNPDTSTTNPDTSTTNPDTSTTNPDTSTTNPDTSTTNPDTSTTNPDTSTTNPDTSTTNPDTSTTNPDTSTTNPDTSTTNPDTSTTNPDTSTTNPDTSTTTTDSGAVPQTSAATTLVPSSVLPSTGSGTVLLSLIAGASLAFGLVTVFAVRRRPSVRT